MVDIKSGRLDSKTEILNNLGTAAQFASQWEFYIEDWDQSEYKISRFKVISSNLPMVRLTTQTHKTGQSYYTGYTMPSTVSLSLREDVDFSVYNYFKDWESKIFDEQTGCFISSPEVKTKNAVLKYTAYTLDAKKSDFYKLAIAEGASGIANRLTGTAFEQVNRQVSLFTGATGLNNSMALPQEITKLTTGPLKPVQGSISSLFGGDYLSSLFKEKVTKEFNFLGLRYQGMGDISNSYGSDNELTISVNLAVDRVTDRLG